MKTSKSKRKPQNKLMIAFVIFAFTFIIGLLVSAFTEPHGDVEPRSSRANLSITEPKVNKPDTKPAVDKGVVQNNSSSVRTETKTFAKPNEIYGNAGKEIMLKPAYGKHRPDRDAVFAIADGYPLNVFIQFVGSLRATGFDGDIVLGTSPMAEMEDSLQSYLTSQEGLVLYNLEKDCSEGRCKLNNLYGSVDGVASEDIRVHRPIATSRFEAYWIWSTHYGPKSMILLLDGRDAYFQLQPFEGLERSPVSASDGVLHFFSEMAAIRTSKQYNVRWLRTAYPDRKLYDYFLDEKIICSGSTMGEQVAMEAYLRAFATEFDLTQCLAKGCDQGLHNYLYYASKLKGVKGISKVVLHEQGKGNVNNLAGLRDKSLADWGIFKRDGDVFSVSNWDGKVAPILHQVDRDKELNALINRIYRRKAQEWIRTSKV